ncbi:unnamed protein product [Rhizophagus irregularis]|nr:unnamed protein product [Rhizophagus irregularis]
MIDPEVINASNVKEENYLITEETIMNDNFKSNESIGNIDVNSGLAIGSNESSKNMDLYRGSAVESNESSENIRDIAIEDTSSTSLLNENSCSSNEVFKNDKNAFDLVKKFAEENYIDAQYQLGYYYDKGIGIGTKADKNKAFKLYKQAAGKGNNDAKCHIKSFSQLGVYYLKGTGTKKNTNKMIELSELDGMIKKNVILHKISLLVRDLRDREDDEKRAFKLLFALAVKEYQDAQFILGYYHEKGIKNSINVLKALELYNKILTKDIDSDAQYKLILLCRLREGIRPYVVVENRRKNKKQATNMNNLLLIIVALILCLSFFISNYGLTKDIKELLDIIKGQQKRDIQTLSLNLDFGIGTKIHKHKAFRFYTKAAKEGHHVAQYKLSILYETGEGVSKDEKKSFEIIEELAKEHASAQHRLGYYYEKGIGTDANILKAFELYHTAAENGITEAIKSSSSLIFKLGEKIIKGETKAFEIVKLYQTAEKNKNIKAIISLERLLHELGDKRKAFDIVKELADKGYANAQHRLGYYYEKGIGTHINIPKARELYTIAVINENIEALKSLNDLISNHGT